jgi:hypothetical protein
VSPKRRLGSQITIASWLVTTLAVGTALTTLLVACGRTEQGNSKAEPSPTFADGLTAEEIMERASEAGESVHSVRIVQTERNEFLGVVSESAFETILVNDDSYMKITDEDGVSEMLHYAGQWYKRSSSSGPWNLDPDLEGVFAQLPGLEQRAEDVLLDPSFALTRLEDQVAGGRKLLRVSAETSSRVTDARAILEALPDTDAEIPPLPDELLPDEVSVTLNFWVGANDFNLYRWEIESLAYKDGNPISSGRRIAEASGFNEQLELPGPLPGG